MTDDAEPIRWDTVKMLCPICIIDFDSDEEEVPPILELVGEVDHEVEPLDIRSGDGIDLDLFEQRYESEPKLWCRECDSIYEIDLVPRPSSSDAARRLAASREQTRRMFERYDEEPVSADEALEKLSDADEFNAEFDELDDGEKARFYRRWRRGEVSDEDAKVVFGEEWQTVKTMAANDEIVQQSSDASASNNDLFFEGQQDEEESSVVTVADKDAMRIAEILRAVDNEEAEYWAGLLDEHAMEHTLPTHIDGEPVEAVVEELADRRELLDMMSETPTNEPSDDLIDDEE